MKKKYLNLEDIYLKDERFRSSYFFSLDKLMLSLNRIGLINPPLVNFRNNRFILVSGWKRVLACFQVSLLSIPVFMVEEVDALKTFLMAFYENLATRDFSLLEKAEILRKLKEFGEGEKNIIKHYMPLLNIPQTVYHLDLFITFSRFEPELKKVIHEKCIPFSSLEILAGLSSSERRLLLPLFLPLSQNKQKEVLGNLREISLKNDMPVEEVLKSAEILEVMDSEKLSPLQKANKIRLLLKRKRYPQLHLWREDFDSSLKKVRWPKDIAVNHSPFFEDENITVHFSFKNEREFRSHLSKLQEVASRKEFSRLFKYSSND